MTKLMKRTNDSLFINIIEKLDQKNKKIQTVVNKP